MKKKCNCGMRLVIKIFGYKPKGWVHNRNCNLIKINKYIKL